MNLNKLRSVRWEKKLTDCDVNHTSVFKIAKSLKRKTTSIPPLQGNIVSDCDKAKLIAETFHKNHDNPLKNKLKVHTKLVDSTVKSFLTNSQPIANNSQFIDYSETVDIVKGLKTTRHLEETY